MTKRMRASLVLAASLAVAASSPAQAQAAAATRSLVLDATRSGPTINRDVFGQFAEHLGQGIYGGVWVGPNSKIPNVRGIRTDVVQALRALKVPVAGPEAASLTHTIGAMGSARPASARRP